MQILNHIDEFYNHDSEYLISKGNRFLEKLLNDKNYNIQDIDKLNRLEAIIQLLNIRKLSPSIQKTFENFKNLIDSNTILKCRCNGHNSIEVVGIPFRIIKNHKYKNKNKGAEDMKNKENKDDERVHIYGRFVNEMFKKWENDSKIKMDFCEYLDKYITPQKRLDLNKNIVNYLSPTQADQYKTKFVNGKLFSISENIKFKSKRYMFVLDMNEKDLYVSKKKKGSFHHTSFLLGAPVKCAGFITLRDNRVVAVKGHSGHYKPDMYHMLKMYDFLAHPNRMNQDGADKVKITVFSKNKNSTSSSKKSKKHNRPNNSITNIFGEFVIENKENKDKKDKNKKSKLIDLKTILKQKSAIENEANGANGENGKEIKNNIIDNNDIDSDSDDSDSDSDSTDDSDSNKNDNLKKGLRLMSSGINKKNRDNHKKILQSILHPRLPIEF